MLLLFLDVKKETHELQTQVKVMNLNNENRQVQQIQIVIKCSRVNSFMESLFVQRKENFINLDIIFFNSLQLQTLLN